MALYNKSTFSVKLDMNNFVMGHDNSVFKIPLVSWDPKNPKLGTFNYAWMKKGMELYPHSHVDGKEFFLFISGTGSMMIDNFWFDVEPNDFITVPEGLIHSLKTENDEPLIFLTVRTINL